MIPLSYYLILSGILFSIGVLGILIRRNAIMILLSLEIMLNAVNLSFVSFSRFSGNLEGQIFVFFIMTIAAAEVAVGLAILISIFRNKKSVDTDYMKSLRW
ncbi:MAG: NADH-quinone oxidoreductase subunit NuoK [Chlamydiae bacterium]|nr:NADH-quinone oxidoreductase subunit NuoK [Chlamydiota bacterium]MBI3266461.1 NADH-quinone oxidoreductase subunit NuoK [Chlamydiota bacterium]